MNPLLRFRQRRLAASGMTHLVRVAKTKELKQSADGQPILRLLASGTKMDSAQYEYQGVQVIGEKVTPELLQSMAEQARNGGVYLIESHSATLPMGISVDAAVQVADDGENQELFVDFLLDAQCDTVKTLLRRMSQGYTPDCSVGLFVKREVEYDPAEGGYVGKLVEGYFEHLALTRPGHAAYPDADIEEVFLTDGFVEAMKSVKRTAERIEKRLFKTNSASKSKPNKEGVVLWLV